uniref:BZIP domain-containing protein n=1 Tax=Globisporangium ultimum (strain ATCC 200006 / CBS 805.95 / DAOM BR144) TaxID=431595 RepID=K3WC57_GLOUD
MLMEHSVLRSTWPISDQEYPVGLHSSIEQQHFPTLMPFSSYSAFPPPPTRFKDASPRTFGSIYPPSSSSSTHSPHMALHSLPLSLSIPRPSGSRKASEEERKAKHREAQRRFVKRKKAEMVQLKQLAIELELQYKLLELMSEQSALAKENYALENDIATTRENATHSEKKTDVKEELPPIPVPNLSFDFEW